MDEDFSIYEKETNLNLLNFFQEKIDYISFDTWGYLANDGSNVTNNVII